jgi:uncharacterized membrane protein
MDTGKSAIGLDGNLAAALGYPIGIIALISFFMEKENKFVRFHAIQSLLFGIGAYVCLVILMIVFGIIGAILANINWILGAIFGLLWFVVLFLFLGVFIVLIYAAVKAYGGNMIKLPIVGNIAEGMVNK